MINNKSTRLGEKHLTNEGYEVEIIEYFTNKNCTIKFNDDFKMYKVRYEHIKAGSVKNLYHKSVFGIGYLGEGKYKAYINDDFSLPYKYWKNMLCRCYDEKTQKQHPTYKEVTVCEEWKCFQNFAAWFEENYIEGRQLDKDILIKGNKIYSYETCCFVPQEINLLFVNRKNSRGDLPIGVSRDKKRFVVRLSKCGYMVIIGYFKIVGEAFEAYKLAKEEYIKEVADEWKDRIEIEVYQAMYNWVVEITD